MNYLQNIKLWFNNNLGAIGKWGIVSFLFGVAVTAFVFGGNLPLHAYVGGVIPTSSYQQTEFKLDLTDPLNSINSINNITLPIDNLINNAIKGLRFDQNINIGTWIPVVNPIKSPSQDIDLSRFFTSSKVSSDDITNFLKEAAITGINLSILIISITSQILKGLLSVLK